MTKAMKAKMLDEEENAIKHDPEEKIENASDQDEVNFGQNDNDHEKETVITQANTIDYHVEEDIEA